MKSVFLYTILAAAILSAAPARNDGAAYEERAIPFLAFGEFDDGRRDARINFSNNTNQAATLELEMYDRDGRAIEIPYEGDRGGVVWLKRHSTTVSANARRLFTTESRGSKGQWGWLRVISSPPGAITVHVEGLLRNEDRLLKEFDIRAVAPKDSFVIGPFKDGRKDHYLLANTAPVTNRVTLIVRDRSGAVICSGQFDLPPAVSYKFPISNPGRCPATTGVLEVRSEPGGVSAMILAPRGGGEFESLYDLKFFF